MAGEISALPFRPSHRTGRSASAFNQVSPLPRFLGQVHREFRALIGPGWCVTWKPQEDVGGDLLLKLEVGDAH